MVYFSLMDLEQRLNGDFSPESLLKAIENASDPSLKATLTHLLNPNARLFLSWMEQWPELIEISTEGGTALPFRDRLKLQEHVLYPQFKAFVTPFLLPSFLGQLRSGEWTETLEYVVVLKDDDRLLVEQEAFSIVEQEFGKALTIANKDGSTEEELISVLHDVLNDQSIRILNSFSKGSYQLVVRFVESLLQLLKSKACTFRLANWMVSQLQTLKLNPEHIAQLADVKKDLKEGNVQLKTRFFSSWKLKLKPWFATIGLTSFLVVIMYFIVTKPWSEQVDRQEIELPSSLTEFTIEERKHIDSLIALHQPTTFSIEYDDDNLYVEGREILVDARVFSKNEAIEGYFKNWESYLAQDSIRTSESCKSLERKVKRTLPDGFSDLKSKKNGQLSYIWNESNYAIHFLLFSDVAGGKAYFKELKEGEELEFFLSPNDHLCFIAGNFTIPFVETSAGLVFCEVDIATFTSLLNVYVVKQQANFYSKIIVTGSNTASFQVVDVNGSLELIR